MIAKPTRFNVNCPLIVSVLVWVALSAVVAVRQARANALPLGAAENYAVIYEGIGGADLQINNVNIDGNIGVGGTGKVQYNGPGAINGQMNFSAGNTSQFSNNNGLNIGPSSVAYHDATVTTALTDVDILSFDAGSAAGTGLAINGNQTINESAGMLEMVDGVASRVFDITSYSENDGDVVTINGDGSGDPVVFDFAGSLGNVNLKGDVTLTGGLTDDQVLWNFLRAAHGTNDVNLSTNDSTYPALAFQGVILAPTDVLSMNAANLDGALFGGDSSDMQIVSHSNFNVPALPAPEPATLSLLLVAGLVGTGKLFSARRFSETS